MPQITSEKNPKIQRIIRLREKARQRSMERLFVIEGIREITLALKGGYRLTEIFFCRRLARQDALAALKANNPKATWVEISENAYEKIAMRETTEGVIAVAEMRDIKLEQIKLAENPFLLVVESVEKPGNLGALLRTTDAAALDAVLVCDPHADLFSPNVIRSSLGCLFTQQIAFCTAQEAISWLRKKGVKILAATPGNARHYASVDFTQPAAIVVGSEATGLSSEWLREADAKIFIPMRGVIDSLNVSVSAAIILFEAVRQRQLLPGIPKWKGH
ncbi:MAG TPA: RNA methyltransferase [Chitinophagales bacterium]|nr:RNA methyltransferase [Chitinophagales bacterium]